MNAIVRSTATRHTRSFITSLSVSLHVLHEIELEAAWWSPQATAVPTRARISRTARNLNTQHQLPLIRSAPDANRVAFVRRTGPELDVVLCDT